MENSPSKLLKLGQPVGVAERGHLYTYRYIATTVAKDKIPYWDMYPVVMVTRLFMKGFQGLNFNYLERDMRDGMMEEMKPLFQMRGQERFFDYQSFLMVLQQRQWRPALVCMRSYRYENLRTPLIEVYDRLWEETIKSSNEMFHVTLPETNTTLPVESEIVWEDQRVKIIKE